MSRAQDLKPGDPGYTALRESILSGLRADRDRWRRLDQQMAASDRAIAALVERERAAAREQVATTPVVEQTDDPPAEPVEGLVPDPPPADEDIFSISVGSPEHRRLREQLGIGRSSNHMI